MLTRIRERFSAVSRGAWLAIGGGVLVLVAAVAVLLILDPFGGPYQHLDAGKPAYTHPDGLVVQLAPGIGEADVQVTTIPREVFTAGDAGGDWQAAQAALPPSLTPLSPIYTIKVKRGQVIADMAIPNGADPLALVDLTRWDPDSKSWQFVPSQQKPDMQAIEFTLAGGSISVMAVHAAAVPFTAAVVIAEGGTDPGTAFPLAFPRGISIDAQGQIVGTAAESSATTVMPLISHRDSGAINFADLGIQSSLASQLEQIALPYDGLVIDFDPGLGYADFVALLGKQIHAQGKHVDIIIRGTSLEGYDVPGLAKTADRFWYAPGDNPTLYLPGGQAETGLAELVAMVDRQKVGLLVSGLDVDVSGGTEKTLTSSESLAAFGAIQPEEGYSDTLNPGDSLAMRLSGQVTSMGFDDSLKMNYLTYTDAAGQEHHIYFGSGQAIGWKLGLANTYALGGVAAEGISAPDAPPGLADGFNAFLSQQQAAQPQPNQLSWQVSGPDGATVGEQSGDLSLLQYLWQAVTSPGQYVVSASLGDNQTTPRPISTMLVNVAEIQATGTPTPTPTPTVRPNTTPQATSQATAAAQPSQAPISGSIAGGTFELGGQVNGSISHGAQMQQAGMTWVKFQHKWSAGESPSVTSGNIGEAHSKGFKVLMSIPGPESPNSINFAEYANFVGGVAAQGADAIEVWNEMNLDREWPANDLSGTSYVVNMLAPAAAAIRAGNPNTIIISGAPSPSGAFGGCGAVQLPGGGNRAGCDDWYYIKQMADSGAANYADCIGVHYNAGATSPAATTGHPNDDGGHHYSWYYQPMVNLYFGTFGKPLCFTELGYASTEGVGGGSAAFPWASSITVAEQAQWLSEAAILGSQSGKVRLMIIWNVDFTGGEGGDPQAAYAIIRPGGGCPACDALQSAH